MEIIRTGREANSREKYAMTKSQLIGKMSEHKDEILTVENWCEYHDTDSKGEVKKLLSIMTPDGIVLATVSETFQRDFSDILDVLTDNNEPETGFDIKVITGTSKNNREFVTCTLV